MKHIVRNQRLRIKAEKINRHATRRETEEQFRSIKDDSSSFKAIKKNNKCDPEKLKAHFSKHFNIATPADIPDELLEAPDYILNLRDTSNIEINHDSPTKQEIKGVLKHLKNGKASTDMPSELLKYASDSEELLSEVHHLLCSI